MGHDASGVEPPVCAAGTLNCRVSRVFPHDGQVGFSLP